MDSLEAGEMLVIWDIKTEYDVGGVHFNSAGHGQIAQALADSLKPTATFDNDFSTWESGNVTVNYNLIQSGDANTLNISQTASSGIEYSTDGSTWYDTTDGGGASEGLTGLASASTPGVDHIFVWDSATDLSNTEDSTVYLRVRPNDGTVDADSWVTSTAFGIDNVAPSSVGAPSFGAISTSSIEINKPSAVTENGSGLYQWQVRKDNTAELGFIATSTPSVVDSSLSENTQHTYDAQFKDKAANTSDYGTSTSKYTLIETPTGISFDEVTSSSLTISVTGTLSNLTSGSSGVYFNETSGNAGGANSSWLQATSYQNTGLSENTQYTFRVKARNADATETNYTTASSKYTLVNPPANLIATTVNNQGITLTVDSFLNDTSDSSGYYFYRQNGPNSGWIQTNSWQDTNIACNQSYTYYVKYRNGDGVETDVISLTQSAVDCGAVALPFIPPPITPQPPSPPEEGKIPIERPITEMTIGELKVKIREIRFEIINLLKQLIQLIQQRITSLKAEL
ncbi:MAG: fibronectin type III domain-containing protein, partial [Deltaproteobacteria bacterium]|nr:fibronectin type III domain-containing protein [Deltaproteobacteria bacterium]